MFTDLMILNGLDAVEVDITGPETEVTDEAPLVLDQTEDVRLAPQDVSSESIPEVVPQLEAEAAKAEALGREAAESAKDAAAQLERMRQIEEEARAKDAKVREAAARTVRLESARRVVWAAAHQAATRQLADVLRAQAALLRLYQAARQHGDTQVMREVSAAYDALGSLARRLRLETRLSEVDALIQRRQRMLDDYTRLLQQPFRATTAAQWQRLNAHRQQLLSSCAALREELKTLTERRKDMLRELQGAPEELPEHLDGFWSTVRSVLGKSAGGMCDIAHSLDSGKVGAAATASPYAALAAAAVSAVGKGCKAASPGKGDRAAAGSKDAIIVHEEPSGGSILPWVVGLGLGGAALLVLTRR
jgi:hypothetical protein